MPAEERRRAIVEAVLPVILETGSMPSTREIAAAAGVAEGTIFRVFDDKPALLHAVAEHVLNPPGREEAFRSMVLELPDLRAKIRLVVDRMQETSRRAMTVLMVLRQQMGQQPGAGHLPKPTEDRQGPPEFIVRANEVLLERLVFVFDQHRDELRTDPETAALVLRSLVFGAQHPGMTGPAPLTPDQIADVVLHGVSRKDDPCC